MRSIDLQVDATEAAALGEPPRVALTFTLPDELGLEPTVCCRLFWQRISTRAPRVQQARR
ncbi:MAG TPA: hypothetical protein VIY26_12710 [Acidimicrobiales bacterium]